MPTERLAKLNSDVALLFVLFCAANTAVDANSFEPASFTSVNAIVLEEHVEPSSYSVAETSGPLYCFEEGSFGQRVVIRNLREACELLRDQVENAASFVFVVVGERVNGLTYGSVDLLAPGCRLILVDIATTAESESLHDALHNRHGIPAVGLSLSEGAF